MALVRKTVKVRMDISEKIHQLKMEKLKVFMQAQGMKARITNFLELAFAQNQVIPKNVQDIILNRDVALENVFDNITPLKASVIVRMPQEDRYWGRTNKEVKPCEQGIGYARRVLLQFDLNEYTMPVLSKPTLLNEASNFHTAISNGLSNEPQNEFIMAYDIGRSFHLSQGNNNYKLDITTVPKFSSYGNKHWEWLLSNSHYKNVANTPMFTCKEGDELFNHMAYFQGLNEPINKMLQRFEKTELYIFEELWKLPSINKMVEFFPGLTAFLSDEIMDRMMSGTQKQRKTYDVAHPDSDVLVSVTEAKIKS